MYEQGLAIPYLQCIKYQTPSLFISLSQQRLNSILAANQLIYIQLLSPALTSFAGAAILVKLHTTAKSTGGINTSDKQNQLSLAGTFMLV